MSLFSELKRRNVHRVAGLYLVAAWLIVQVAETLFPLFGHDETPARITVIVLAIGFVPALVFSWVFEITPEGVKRESEIDRTLSITPQTGRKMDRAITGVLLIALIYFAIDKFVLAPQREATRAQQQAAQLSSMGEEARAKGRTEAIVESYGEKSIAVLPFTDMSPAQDQDYMGDGLAEELLNLLVQIPELRVISRSSAFSFKGKDIEIPEIARRLNVAHVLEGSVRKSGNKIRITAQLIEARSDTHLWSQTWDRELADIFVIQDEIAEAIVEQLRIKLLGEVPKAKEVNPEAYGLYLQARQLADQHTPEGYEQAILLYGRALAIDLGYAAAWVGLASVYGKQVNRGLRPPAEGGRLAREAVTTAVGIDPAFAPAHAELAWIAQFQGDLAAAARHLERALTLDPTTGMESVALLASNLGRLDTAIFVGEYNARRDPLKPSSHLNLGVHYLHAGRLDEAIASFRVALTLSPRMEGAHYGVGVALLAKGQQDAALVEVQEEPSEGWRLVGLALVYHALGRKSEADATLTELVNKHGDFWPYNIAYIYAYRGEADRAFEWLDKAVDLKDTGVSGVANERLFTPIHNDPRWLPFLRKIGRAPEQLAAIKFDVNLPQQ